MGAIHSSYIMELCCSVLIVRERGIGVIMSWASAMVVAAATAYDTFNIIYDIGVNFILFSLSFPSARPQSTLHLSTLGSVDDIFDFHLKTRYALCCQIEYGKCAAPNVG